MRESDQTDVSYTSPVLANPFLPGISSKLRRMYFPYLLYLSRARDVFNVVVNCHLRAGLMQIGDQAISIEEHTKINGLVPFIQDCTRVRSHSGGDLGYDKASTTFYGPSYACEDFLPNIAWPTNNPVALENDIIRPSLA